MRMHYSPDYIQLRYRVVKSDRQQSRALPAFADFAQSGAETDSLKTCNQLAIPIFSNDCLNAVT